MNATLPNPVIPEDISGALSDLLEGGESPDTGQPEPASKPVTSATQKQPPKADKPAESAKPKEPISKPAAEDDGGDEKPTETKGETNEDQIEEILRERLQKKKQNEDEKVQQNEEDEDVKEAKMAPPELRRAYEELKRKVRELESRSAEADKVKLLAEENKTLKARLQKIEELDALGDFLQSDDYQSQEKPVRDLYARLTQLVQRQLVEETGKPGTENDAVELLRRAWASRTDRELMQAIGEMFGDDAKPILGPVVGEILQRERQLVELRQNLPQRALEWKKKQAETARERLAKLRARAADAGESIFEKFGQAYGLDDDDRKVFELTASNFDRVMFEPPSDPNEFAVQAGKWRAYAALTLPLLRKIGKMEEELEELRSQVKVRNGQTPRPKPSSKTEPVHANYDVEFARQLGLDDEA